MYELPGALVLEALDDVEFGLLERLEAALNRAVRSREGAVIVDVAHHFIGMAGIDALVSASEAACRRDLALVVVGLPDVWDKVLPLIGVDGRIRRAVDVASAYRVALDDRR